jgi:putative tryptophan/tyrosine transport system substrate-binding protein
MQRRQFIQILGGAAAWPMVAQAQRPGKVWRIGYLSAGDEPGTGHLYRSFVQGMRDHGYFEGQNVVYELRYANSDRKRITQLFQELAGINLDVIMTTSQAGAVAAQTTWLRTPVVTVIASDPVAEGLVQSLSHPGGYVTGVANMNAELGGKRLALLREVAPTISRVAVIFDPTATGNSAQMESIQRAASAMSVAVLALEVRRTEDIEPAFISIQSQKADALLVTENPVNYPHRAQFVALAGQQRLPAMYGYIEFAQEGGLMAYSSNLPALHRYAAGHVDKILKGEKPGDLPIEQPNLFELIINLKTARSLGLAIPQTLLVAADELIE